MNGLQRSDGRSFWQMPEGKAAKYLMVIGGAVGGFFVLMYTAQVMAMLATFVTTIFMSGLTIGLTFLAALVLTSPFWNDTVGTLCQFALRGLLRGIASIFTAVDPIGVKKTLLERKQKEQLQHKEETGVIEGVARDLREAIEENKRAVAETEGLARQAHKHGKEAAFTVNARQNQRLIATNEQHEKALMLLDAMLAHLYKFDEILTVTIVDLEQQIDLDKRNLKIARRLHKAMGIQKRIMQKGADWDLADIATEQIRDEINSKFGQVAQFRKDMRSTIESFDLKNGMVEEAMLEKLAKSSQVGEQLVSDPALNKRLLPSSTETVDDEGFRVATSTVSDDEIERLFTNRK
jgi:hypothetical protein